jgi:hypothetical protein
MSSLLYCISTALPSLQNVSGIYGMVVPSAAVEIPGQIVENFVGGENLRAVLPKLDGKVRKQRTTLREESQL